MTKRSAETLFARTVFTRAVGAGLALALTSAVALAEGGHEIHIDR